MTDINKMGFHDAVITSITKTGLNIVFEIEAVQYQGEKRTYNGILHFAELKSIKQNGQLVPEIIMLSSDAGILDLTVNNSSITISVIWYDYKEKKETYAEYELIASKIYWQETGIFEE